VARAALRLKSAACQIAYWNGGKLRIANYLTRRTFAAKPVTLGLIQFFFVPHTIREAVRAFEAYSAASVARAIVKLIEGQLLLEYGSVDGQRDRLLEESWGRWLPEAAFHFMTKDTPYVPWDWPIGKKRRLLAASPAPAQFKKYRGAERTRLALPAAATDSFFATLHARRTHREFAAGRVSLENVSRLLHATWGVQGYFHAEVVGSVPYKTSPSGGARHPGEVYLMALRVEGLESGIYHYQAKDHCLARLPGVASQRIASDYCATQPWFGKATALFIMTAVFARTMWKYGRARAYRVVLLESGHLCQTFCLTATRLGLAPFCTAALRDSLIEEGLGLDGISESVLYVAGIGLLPRRTH
jgi:SagB-type dehydrogenase family enzyme